MYSFNLLAWDREPFNGGVTYISDWGGYSITAEYPTDCFESDATTWELFDHNGYSIKTFASLKDAQDHAEYLYESKD